MHALITRAAVAAALAGGLTIAGATAAQADTPADGLTGTLGQLVGGVASTVPVTVDGNTVTILGSTPSPSGSTSTSTDTSGGLLGTGVPVSVSGNTVTILGSSTGSTPTTVPTTAPATTTTTTTTGSKTTAAGKGTKAVASKPATKTTRTSAVTRTTSASGSSAANRTGSDVRSSADPCLTVTSTKASQPLADSGSAVELVEGGIIALLVAALAYVAGRRVKGGAAA